MNQLKKGLTLSFTAFLFLSFVYTTAAQDRPRVVRSASSRPTTPPPAPATAPPTRTTAPSSTTTVTTTNSSRPVLTNTPVVQQSENLVKKTGDASPMNQMNNAFAARKTVYGSKASNDIMFGINARLGIPYRYGSSGPNTYDCSGFVWSVFRDAGLEFTRTSARSLWQMSTPVEGDERYIFGTLVFLNKLGHIGIVADENGFYHASRSKGITYSTFKGYWENRIDGFRRLDLQTVSNDTQR